MKVCKLEVRTGRIKFCWLVIINTLCVCLKLITVNDITEAHCYARTHFCHTSLKINLPASGSDLDITPRSYCKEFAAAIFPICPPQSLHSWQKSRLSEVSVGLVDKAAHSKDKLSVDILRR